MAALLGGHLSSFFSQLPTDGAGGSLLLRAPAAGMAKWLGGGTLMQFRAGALEASLACGAVGVALASPMRRLGRPPVARTAVIGVCVLSPAVLDAILFGHPEEALGSALCVGASRPGAWCGGRQQAVGSACHRARAHLRRCPGPSRGADGGRSGGWMGACDRRRRRLQRSRARLWRTIAGRPSARRVVAARLRPARSGGRHRLHGAEPSEPLGAALDRGGRVCSLDCGCAAARSAGRRVRPARAADADPVHARALESRLLPAAIRDRAVRLGGADATLAAAGAGRHDRVPARVPHGRGRRHLHRAVRLLPARDSSAGAAAARSGDGLG
jgi:hypothetical protein